MNPIVLALVIAGGVIFLFVLAARLAWYVRNMTDDADGQAAKPADRAEDQGGQSPSQGLPAEETERSDR